VQAGLRWGRIDVPSARERFTKAVYQIRIVCVLIAHVRLSYDFARAWRHLPTSQLMAWPAPTVQVDGENPARVQCGRVSPGADAHRPDSASGVADLTTYIKSLPRTALCPERGRHADASQNAASDFSHQNSGRKEIRTTPVLDVSPPAAYRCGCRLTSEPVACSTSAFAGHRRQRAVLHDAGPDAELLWTTYNTNTCTA